MGFRCIFIYLVIFISFMSCELKTDTIYKYGGFLYQYESDYPDGVIFIGLENPESGLSKFNIPRYIYTQPVVGVRELENVSAYEIYFHENIRFIDIHGYEFSISNIKVLYLHSVVPPSTDADVIRYIRNKAIYVPKESLDAYKAHPFWGNCNNINAIE